MKAITVWELTKEYRQKGGKKAALDNITFSVEQGETVGIIGRNGSGKSTLLKLLAGITAPTRGEIKVAGQVSALLELGAGFHSEYTGMDNIYLNGMLCGRPKQEIREKIPEILDFAQIGDAINQKIKTYSTGMFLRLAFASAIAYRPEILLVDEALAVGDIAFQAKCFQKLKECKAKGTTILYISHDIDAVRGFCDRVIWLDEGKIRMDDGVARVTGAYMAEVVGQGETANPDGFGICPGAIRQVTAPGIWEYGREVTVTVDICLPEDKKPGDLSLSVKNREGLDLLVFSAKAAGIALTGGEDQVSFRFRNILTGGKYLLSVGLEIPDTYPIAYYEYKESALEFQAGATPYFGSFHIPAEVKKIEKDQG